ncbi:MAG: carboxypeptidase regulatory-like domain-containing protein, partial [Acidobacteria bacterium]
MTGAAQRRILFILFVVSLLALPVLGQVDRATVNGRVTDATGGVVPGVEVIATNQNTGVQTTSVTNDLGLYTLSNLPIGSYSIKFSLTGFKTMERTGIGLVIAQVARVDVVLETGEISETVTVSANAELINKDNALVSTVMQSETITDLPLSFAGGRSVENFAYAVTPAVEGDNWTSYIGGGPAFSKEVLIDGISATSQIQGHIGESSPTMEAVQEFKVQTSGMSAEYGHTSGGVFNFALKSGTNDIHGSGFYYTRNEALNANTWMNNWRLSRNPNDFRSERARDRQNLYGGSLGGPVYIPKIYDGRNRTFIFGAFEQFNQERLQLGDMNVTVPLPEFLEGDFSKLLTTTELGKDALGRPVYQGAIYDPKTLHQVDGKWVSDPFPGNIIPKARFSQVSNKIVDLFKKHYTPLVPGLLTN